MSDPSISFAQLRALPHDDADTAFAALLAVPDVDVAVELSGPVPAGNLAGIYGVRAKRFEELRIPYGEGIPLLARRMRELPGDDGVWLASLAVGDDRYVVALSSARDAVLATVRIIGRHYTELPGLAEIVLEESYVLDVVATPGRLVMTADLVLTAAHPAYRPPPPHEQECYRRGTLTFTGIRRLAWSDQGQRPAIDATGEIDWDGVDRFFFTDTAYELTGNFGTIRVEADAIDVALDAP